LRQIQRGKTVEQVEAMAKRILRGRNDLPPEIERMPKERLRRGSI